MIGRFINADTTDVLIVNPTSLTDKNLYAYCDNNPVNRSDNCGEFWNVVIGAVVGGAISAGFEIANQIISQKVTGEPFDWTAVACSALSGAITGGFKASGLGPLGQTIGDALATGITSGYAEYKKGEDADYRAVVVDIGMCFLDYGFGKADAGFGQHHNKLLEQKKMIQSKIDCNGYKTMSVGTKRLRQNNSLLKKSGKKIIKSVGSYIAKDGFSSGLSDYAKSYIEKYVPHGYRWLL